MNQAYFREEQRFRQPWTWMVVVLSSAVSFWLLYRIWSRSGFAEEPLGAAVASLIAFGGPTMFWWARLLTVVEDDRLHISFRPFLVRRNLPASEIVRFQATEYSPILEYGGWGLRWRPGKGKAYNVSGDRGVRLTLSDGEEFLVGSRRPEELETAITQAKDRR